MPTHKKLDKSVRNKGDRGADSVLRRANRVDQHVAKRLRLRREELGFSLAEFASQTHMTAATLKKYEGGLVAITAGRLLVMAEALSCEPDYFFSQFDETASD